MHFNILCLDILGLTVYLTKCRPLPLLSSTQNAWDYRGEKKTSHKNYVLKLCSLLLYTCCCTHEERQISILQRATNHLLGVFPGYQVNSGQNRKAQCRVEMAQRRRWRRGMEPNQQATEELRGAEDSSGSTCKSQAVCFWRINRIQSMEVRFTFLVFKRIHLNLNADVKRITAHGANTVNKQLIKYCGNNNKRKHRTLHTDIVYKSCRWVKEKTRVFLEHFVFKEHSRPTERAGSRVGSRHRDLDAWWCNTYTSEVSQGQLLAAAASSSSVSQLYITEAGRRFGTLQRCSTATTRSTRTAQLRVSVHAGGVSTLVVWQRLEES